MDTAYVTTPTQSYSPPLGLGTSVRNSPICKCFFVDCKQHWKGKNHIFKAELFSIEIRIETDNSMFSTHFVRQDNFSIYTKCLIQARIPERPVGLNSESAGANFLGCRALIAFALLLCLVCSTQKVNRSGSLELLPRILVIKSKLKWIFSKTMLEG
ncbi:hypothetical protein BDQ17DRAFT_789721 [Cyathus striatus]|nr:hypothetical protein BDQ17DRAFT_789721 [Cyathus striatus]